MKEKEEKKLLTYMVVYLNINTVPHILLFHCLILTLYDHQVYYTTLPLIHRFIADSTTVWFHSTPTILYYCFTYV